ncbi:hypothetical protein [Enterococcus sp. DIV1420a]|uniref:hypothetical protein n=1 Tax=Enterococcus sp. DIV1420a TaxID=2774672 RepID=UPI003F26B921
MKLIGSIVCYVLRVLLFLIPHAVLIFFVFSGLFDDIAEATVWQDHFFRFAFSVLALFYLFFYALSLGVMFPYINGDSEEDS